MMDWPADKVERKSVSALVPYARNARTHSEEQVAQIAASIREWGWTVPVLVDEDGGLIAGHGRVLAARKLGLTADALEEWNRVAHWLHRIGLLSEVDRAALAAYAQAYGRWVQAERAIAKMAEKDQLTGGLMIKTSNGNAIQNPLVGTANKAAADMMRYAAEFGMTPSARSRISAEATSEGVDPADRFFN